MISLFNFLLESYLQGHGSVLCDNNPAVAAASECVCYERTMCEIAKKKKKTKRNVMKSNMLVCYLIVYMTTVKITVRGYLDKLILRFWILF